MSMDHRRNDNDSGTRQHSKTALFQCHSVHMNWPGIEPGPPRRRPAYVIQRTKSQTCYKFPAELKAYCLTA